MDSQKLIVCRLCFKIQDNLDNFKAIEDMKNILDKVLQKMDFAATQNPVLCMNCADTLMKCFDFKTKCINTHDCITPFINKKDGVKLDLIDVYISKNESGFGVSNVQGICALCMSPVKNYPSLSVAIEGDIALRGMIERCVPELDMNIIKKPVICFPCHNSLEGCFSFLTHCLIVEEKIKNYRENRCMDSNGGIDLSCLLQCTADPIRNPGGRSTDLIKVENQFCEEIENPDDTEIGNGGDIFEFKQVFCNVGQYSEEFKLKSKHLIDMDKLKFNSEEHFTPKNLLAYKDFIKVEPFCGENGLEEENLVKMEGEEFAPYEEVKIKRDESDFNRFEDGILLEPDQFHVQMENNDEAQINNGGGVFKFEQMFRDDRENIGEEFERKCESFMETGVLKFTSETHFTPKNTLECKDVIKIEEEFFEENKQEENLIEMEDQKFVLDEEVERIIDNRFEDGILPGLKVSKGDIDTHLLTHMDPSEVTMYKCDSCSYQTKHKNYIKRHLLQHKDPSGVTMYKCNFCPYQTKDKSNFNKHLLKHKDPSEVPIYKCRSCSYQSKCKENLKKHLLKHKDPSEVKMYKCNTCLFETKYKMNLENHLFTHRDPSEAPVYKCDSCPYQSKEKRGLKKHLLKHKDPSEVTMYKCESCSYQTNDKRGLTKHSLKHKDLSELPVYKCDYCLFQTKCQRYLKRHLENHKDPSEVTMYKCDSCSFQTKHKRSVTVHLLNHMDPSEITMYKCEFCSYQAKTKKNLKRHSLKHKEPSDVTMYKCDSCSFETRHKKSLNRHLPQHNDSSEVTMYESTSNKT